MGRPAGWMQKLTGRVAMRSPGAPSLRREVKRQFWKQIAIGVTSEKAAEAAGVSQPAGGRWFRHRGGMPLVLNPRLRQYVQDRLEGKIHDARGREVAGPRQAPFIGRNKPHRGDRKMGQWLVA